MSELKERPILFSAPMVRAILDGRKTVTRRAVRKQFATDAIPAEVPASSPEGWQISGHSGLWWDDAGACFDDAVRCPYGRPGDRLWVREGFSGPHYREAFPPSLWHELDEIHYWADGNPVDGDWTRPRPSIHMPRWASRILLEVVAVRVERLQDISEADAMAEGITDILNPVGAYRELWEQINGSGSWAANPWVWCVSFRRVE